MPFTRDELDYLYQLTWEIKSVSKFLALYRRSLTLVSIFSLCVVFPPAQAIHPTNTLCNASKMLVKYSSLVLLLLEKKCPINYTRTWDHEHRLARIGITAKPPFVHDESAPCRPQSRSKRIPAGLSASQTRSFVKFIHRLRAQPESMKLEFINRKGGKEEVGRRVWRHWFRSTIQHCLQRTLTKFFVQIGIHPVQLMYRTGDPRMMQAIPDLLSYTTIVGIDIFGPGVTYKGPDLTYCREEAYIYIEHVAEVWWKRAYKAWNRLEQTNIPEFRQRAQDAINRMSRSSQLPYTNITLKILLTRNRL